MNKNYKTNYNAVHIQKKLINNDMANGSGKPQDPRYIVIHEVSLGLGQSPENFDIEYYNNKINNDGMNGSSIGYHFLVGDKEIYQFLNETQSVSHTGTAQGNQNSIGVERLICEGLDHEQALHNQAKLIATLMIKWNIPIENVITHKEMQNKFSPSTKNYELITEKIDNKDMRVSINMVKISLLMTISKLKQLKCAFGFDKTIKNLDIELNDIIKSIDNFDSFSEQRKILELYRLINIDIKVKKIECHYNNTAYLPTSRQFGNLVFHEKVVHKNCPSRLLAGQRGGLTKFYEEICKCLKYSWYFDDIMNKEASIEDGKQKSKYA